MRNKIGVIDVGGGCRGAYAAGVFDYFLDKNITKRSETNTMLLKPHPVFLLSARLT